MGLRDQLVRHEALRLQVYDDATGVALKRGDIIRGTPTIGVGRSLTVGITVDEAMFLLDNDLDAANRDMRQYMWFRKLSPVRQHAVVAMRFNLGLTGLLKFQRMIAALEAQDYAIAKAEALDSAWSKQVGKRADELAEQLLTGVEVA